jgi:SAM-dependent MidA family methyltransferase
MDAASVANLSLNIRMSLPEPSLDELAHSATLAARLRAEIAAHGPLPFERYMARALYEPGLGYYSAGRTKFGAAGDFVTAPELGEVFARCVARAIAPALRDTGGELIELGPGSGAMAAALLRALAKLDALPTRYGMLETSADLRARQAETLRARVPEFAARAYWLDAPPAQAWQGVLLANEVVDALPARAFVVRDAAVFERTVLVDDTGAFCWGERPAEAAVSARALALRDAGGSAAVSPFFGEYLPQLDAWVRAVTEQLTRGLALFVDYGYPRAQCYAPHHRAGTLMAHYRHRAHDDVLRWVGLQDLTVSVDFTALAEAGTRAGLDLALYASQAQFLFASGLPEIVEQSAILSEAQRLKLMSEVKRLTLPGDMGERFQVMLFNRDWDASAQPWYAIDQSARL